MDGRDRGFLPLVVGPTASGKSALAVALAGALDGEIVSCDSMQVYRGMPVATAQPSEAERQGIPHHLIGFLDPAEPYSVARFCEDASAAVAEGYWRMKRNWRAGDKVELSLAIETELRFADPRVPADAGRAAIQRGPVVYCVESADNPGVRLHSLRLSSDVRFRETTVSGLPEGTVALRFAARHDVADPDGAFSTRPPKYADGEAVAIPYALWQNRGAGAMQVFLLCD